MRRPVPHDASMPATLPPKNRLDVLADEIERNSDEESIRVPKDSTDSEYDTQENLKLILFSQEWLNVLIRDPTLSERKAELLASRLQKNNLLHADVMVAYYRKSNMDLSTVFRVG